MSQKVKNTCFRFYDYSVISLPNSVIYFGGRSDQGASATVAEYNNLKWKILGNLAAGKRSAHRSIKIGTRIFIFGGFPSP